jgi:prepilin-type N-terminal cleavage/methylation domain-containing protein
MKKKKIRGFTLIECLIAMALLGVVSLTMAQVYAAVARMNRYNHRNNVSLAAQMKLVEEYLDQSSTLDPVMVDILTVTPKPTGSYNSSSNKKLPPHMSGSVNAGDPHITIISHYTDGPGGTEFTYSYVVDRHVLSAREVKPGDMTDTVMTNDSAQNLRYQYLEPA